MCSILIDVTVKINCNVVLSSSARIFRFVYWFRCCLSPKPPRIQPQFVNNKSQPSRSICKSFLACKCSYRTQRRQSTGGMWSRAPWNVPREIHRRCAFGRIKTMRASRRMLWRSAFAATIANGTGACTGPPMYYLLLCASSWRLLALLRRTTPLPDGEQDSCIDLYGWAEGMSFLGAAARSRTLSAFL